jgi:NAD(P)-dependent dehydrogenase (short-subunit alcohol dehydrogenase family)
MTDSLPLSDRIALVTGASRGIGEAAALALAAAGAHVIALARTEGALSSLGDRIEKAGGSATLVPFDLRQLDRIDDLGAEIYRLFQRLDILVGNAGILGPISPLGHIKAEEWQKVIDVNFGANWRLIRILDPLLRRAQAARAVFVTDAVVRDTGAFWGCYGASKAALEAMVRSYAAEVRSTDMRVNLLDPGPVRTNLRKKAFPGENPARLPAPAAIAPLVVEMCSPTYERNGEIVRFMAT